MNFKTLRASLLVVVCLFSCTSLLYAQVSTSSITGTVFDNQGKTVPDAKVVLKNEGTGVEYPTTTTSTGDYAVASLVPGSYTVTATKNGFRTYVSEHNVLTVGAPLVVDPKFQLGEMTQTVQVESAYERIESSNATISDVMDTRQVQNLPLNGRNPLSLLTLEPGVVQRTFNAAGSGTHVFGSRDRAFNVTIDGIDANESTVPNPQSNIQRLNPDNVQEFRTVTLGATAENGRNSGANIMVATKPGSNGFHGAVYYFNRNSVYNANEWFNNASGQARPDLKLNQYGFDVGGPIIKNKTFFFASYQGNNVLQTAPIASFFGTPIVYTNSMINGAFRFVRGTVSAGGKTFSQNSPQMLDSSGNLLPGIATCSATVTGNCVDTYNILANGSADASTFGLIKSLPRPNSFASVGDGLNTAGFRWNPPTKFTGPHFLIRVDHNFGPNDTIFVRYLQNHFNTLEGDFVNARPIVYPGFPPLGEVNRNGRNLAISYRHVFTPSLINELTAGFNRFSFVFTFGESNSGFGDPAKDPPWADTCVYGSFADITPPFCVSPHTARAVTTPQLVDNISWIHGSHTVQAGINFRFYYHNDTRGFFGGTILAPGIIFSGTNRLSGFPNIPTGSGASAPNSADITNLQQAIDQIAGLPYEIEQSYRADFNANTYVPAKYATVYTRAHQYDSFIQDEWKFRPTITLTAGLRWEFNPPPYDAKQTLVPNVFPDGSQGPVTFVKADGWFKNDNIKSVAPRVGIAWAPDGKTAIRAGYSLFFDTLSTFQVTAIAGKVPGFMLGCITTFDGSATGTTPGCSTPSGVNKTISGGYPLSIPAPTITPSAALTQAAQSAATAQGVGAFDPNIQNPAVHEWSVTIQRELPQHFVAEIGYIGKRGTHLYRAYDLNQGTVNQPGFISSFNIARANIIAGCRADGTNCPAGVTGQTPALLETLVTPTFIDSSTSRTDFIRSNAGNFAARMDALALTSSQRLPGLTLNYVRPNPQFGQIFYQDSGGDSYYHGVFISARRRFEQGLDLGFSYTFSKSIDDMSVDPTGASTGGGLSSTSFSRTPTDIHNFRLDRSLSDFNNFHVVQGNLLYELPFGHGKKWASALPRWADEIIGGWTVTMLGLYQSGEPYTLSSGARTSNSTHNSTALLVGSSDLGSFQLVSGIQGPVEYNETPFISAPLTDPHLGCSNVTGTQTFFCIPAAGQNGSGRNTVFGPSYWDIDAGLLKNFTLTDRFRLEFRSEAFNVLNHPNFENPRNSTQGSATITSTAFGQMCCSTAAVASAQNVNPVGESYRVLQLSLKLNF